MPWELRQKVDYKAQSCGWKTFFVAAWTFITYCKNLVEDNSITPSTRQQKKFWKLHNWKKLNDVNML